MSTARCMACFLNTPVAQPSVVFRAVTETESALSVRNRLIFRRLMNMYKRSFRKHLPQTWSKKKILLATVKGAEIGRRNSDRTHAACFCVFLEFAARSLPTRPVALKV